MITVVGVRFKAAGKVYYFDPDELELTEGSEVIVETARGLEFGIVTAEPCKVNEKSVVKPLKKVMRIADENDLKKHEDNMRRKESVLKTCQEKIDSRKLEMKLIDVEFTFDNSKVIFYFTADGRVDFRDLVKDLAGVFRMRIELRQVGVRDEAKMFGGVGTCGKGLCCHTWLSDFNPVSIKMAKQQGLSLNPTKISGVCGRLMCCLRYENEAYQYLRKGMPDVGEHVKTPDGMAVVVDTNLMREKVSVRMVLQPDRKAPDEEKLGSDVNVYKKSEIHRLEKRKKLRKQHDEDDWENLPEEVRNLLGD
ncbi:MAG: PSP1 domain-containing protein [Anaerovoracaceae bacterium]